MVMLSFVACAIASITVARAEQPLIERDVSRFVGTWELVSLETHWPDGHVTMHWGAHPPGRLIYDADGRMVALLMHERRNQAGPGGLPAELQNEVVGYFGTYRVDSTRHVVQHMVQASIRSSESGTLERAYEFDAGDLRLTAKGTRDGLPVVYFLVWRRSGAAREPGTR